jgi:hypothetical protein|tara:strand:- start:189 stop:530 length:342 start_codon:yes stop_codon:yes gene_type:complete
MSDIIKGSKKLAVYMGYTYIPHSDAAIYRPGWWLTPVLKTKVLSKQDSGLFLCRRHSQLRYYNSYEWLMTVVEKIMTFEEKPLDEVISLLTEDHGDNIWKMVDLFHAIVGYVK